MTNPTPSHVRVLAVPAFQDNYLWLIHDGVHAAAVDPGDAAPIRAALDAHHLTLTAILLTHHHADHIGGVPALLSQWPGLPVFGPPDPRIPAVTVPLSEGERITVPGVKLALEVLEVPGHTTTHIAYLGDPDHQPWLFSGDTLFAAGCGRLFDGTAVQLRASLDRLATLPGDTLVYCAHEYTLSNLRFATAMEPDNARLRQRVEDESAKRRDGMATVPTTIALERATNPFLRYREPAIVHTLIANGKVDPFATEDMLFSALRAWKNTF